MTRQMYPVGNGVSRSLVCHDRATRGPLTPLLGFLAQGTGQPPQAPAPLAAPRPVMIHEDHF
jgi:hypothetical protein